MAQIIYGCTLPRIESVQAQPLTPATTMGYKCIQFAEVALGMRLLPWQEHFLKRALEVDAVGEFKYRYVYLGIARQQGKSTIMSVVALFMMFMGAPGELVLGTAQDLDTSEGTWSDAVDRVEAVPALAGRVSQVVRTNGKKALVLTNGSRWKVASASRSGGRGKSAALVLFDELREHLTFDAWNAIANTTIARSRAQIWGVSNAGDGRSLVLKHLRDLAISQKDDPDSSVLICEWSADEYADPDDIEAWRQANPSLGYTVTMEALKAARATSTEAGWRTENLCQWVTSTLTGPWADGAWDELADQSSRFADDSPLWLAVDTGIDRKTTYIVAAGWSSLPAGPAGRRVQVEVIAKRPGNAWAPLWLARRWDALGPAGVLVQGRGAPATDLIEALEAQGIPVTPVTGGDVTGSALKFYDAVRDRLVVHGAQPPLDMAATTAELRYTGDGIFMFDRRRSPVDVAPLIAASFAWYYLTQEVEDDTPRSVYDSRDEGLVVI